MQERNEQKRQAPILVSMGRASQNVTPDSSPQEIVNAVYKKGHGPANARGVQIARGILRVSQRVQALKKARRYGRRDSHER